MKSTLKQGIVRSPLYSIYRKYRNQDTITTLMLHRILPRDEIEIQGANPEWTLSLEVFKELLVFISKHYKAISIEDLDASGEANSSSSKHKLLLTFDDGWQDNYEYAYPELRSAGIPAHIFVVTDFIGQQTGFLEEQVFSALIREPSVLTELACLLGLDNAHLTAAQISNSLLDLSESSINRTAVMNIIEGLQPGTRQMLNDAEIRRMSDGEVTFGSHGSSHRKLGDLMELEVKQELDRSKESLEKILGKPINSVSFPHGSTSIAVNNCCEKRNLRHRFTSERKLYSALGPTYPRVHLSEESLTRNGKFDESKTAFFLSTLPRT